MKKKRKTTLPTQINHVSKATRRAPRASRKPQDLTLRNLRALKKRMALIELSNKALAVLVDKLRREVRKRK